MAILRINTPRARALALGLSLLSSILFGGGSAQAVEAPVAGACATTPRMSDPLVAPHWNGWGVDVAQSRFQPAAMAQLAAADVPRLKLKWAFGFPGAERSIAQPTVMGGRLFVGSPGGIVYALDAASGCVIWRFDAQAPVRAAIVLGRVGGKWEAFFGDGRAAVHALDAETGAEIWKLRVDEHATARITGASTLAGGLLLTPVSSAEEIAAANPFYACCTFRGSLVAIDTATGKVAWKSYTVFDAPGPRPAADGGRQMLGPSGAALWASPTLDGATRTVYAVTGDNYSDPPTTTSDAILAFDSADGRLKWSRQITPGDAYNVACAAEWKDNCPASRGPDADFGASPILLGSPGGRRLLVVGQKSGMVTAVDPDRGGEILWQKRIGAGGPIGGVQWGMASDGANIYAAVSDAKFRQVAAGTPGSRPAVFKPDLSFLVDANSGGGLHALDAATGESVWSSPHPGCGNVAGCSPAQPAAVTAIPGVVFSGGLDGHIRAYDAKTGNIIWDFNTARDYAPLNGGLAHGGSIDGPGAVVVGGVVYVTSGSAFLGTMPGNALLAFTVDGN